MRARTNYKNREVTSNIYVKCKEIIVQIVVFHEYGSFLWNGADDYSPIRAKWFGDTARAMQRYFLYLYKMSVFIFYNFIFQICN